MGNGIVVITEGTEDGRFRRAGGEVLSGRDLSYHAAGILSGLYSLGGSTDAVLVEERLRVHHLLQEISYDGVPDIRTITFLGVPVMSMMRLPTKAARGRANLHQGAVGVGIDNRTGRTTHAIVSGEPIANHPDTGAQIVDRDVPFYAELIRIAAEAAAAFGLGYIGVDVVVDETHGPLVLELNARPGLAIQLANQAGIMPRIDAVRAHLDPEMTVAERIELGRSL